MFVKILGKDKGRKEISILRSARGKLIALKKVTYSKSADAMFSNS